MAELQPKVTSSGGLFSLAALTDGDLATATLLPAAPVEQKAWIQFEFAAPQTVRGLTLATGGGGRGGRGGGGPSGPELESSNDGQNFQTAVAIPAGARTIAFPAVTAKFFRVSFRTQPMPAGGRGGAGGMGWVRKLTRKNLAVTAGKAIVRAPAGMATAV